MKLQSLKLENFQSHQDSTIKFHPNFNCIVGPTNVGKTAIFNALLFVFMNEWDPDFLRHGTTKCRVRIQCDELTVDRIKGKTVNTLEITANGTPLKYDNFGTEYPPEVKRLFSGIINEIPVCVAYQDSNSFLIHDTPSVKGKILSYLSGISILDETAARLSAKERELKTDIETMEAKNTYVIQELVNITALGDLDLLATDYEASMSEYNRILVERQKVLEISDKIAALDARVAKLNQTAKTGIDNPDKVVQFIDTYVYVQGLIDKLDNTQARIDNLSRKSKTHSADMSQLLTELMAMMRENKLCPFCGSPLSGNAVDHIMRELL